MASFHPHHHPSNHCHCQTHAPSAPITTTTTTTCCCCTCSCHCNNNHHPSPPSHQPLSIDPLLQSLAFLLQQQQQQQQQRPNLCSNNKPQTHRNTHQRLRFHPQKLNVQQHLISEEERDQSFLLLPSLLQRINTLESSLQNFSASSSNKKHFHHSFSLRDAAARVIQTHFRAFLVRRSRTLSQLQDLAFIKSSFNAIKSSVSSKTHLNCGLVSRKAMDLLLKLDSIQVSHENVLFFHYVSRKAMDLLLKLDSIQGGDPLIRDGKSSISRDIVRFLEFIDGLAGNRQCKPVKNVRFARNRNKARTLISNIGYEDLTRNQKEIVEKLSERVQKIRGFSKVCDNDEEDVELEGFQQFIDDEEEAENVKVSKIRNGILVKTDGSKPRVKKSVSFDEDGNVYRILSDSQESVLNGDGSFTDGSDSSEDHGETITKGIGKDEVVQVENLASTQSNDGGINPVRNSRGSEYYEIKTYCHDQDGNLVFSAPIPVKMESKSDLMKKKPVKIVR